MSVSKKSFEMSVSKLSVENNLSKFCVETSYNHLGANHPVASEIQETRVDIPLNGPNTGTAFCVFARYSSIYMDQTKTGLMTVHYLSHVL